MYTISERNKQGYYDILDNEASIAQTKAERAAKRIITALEVMVEVNRLVQYVEDMGTCPECSEFGADEVSDSHAEHCHIGRILEAAEVIIG